MTLEDSIKASTSRINKYKFGTVLSLVVGVGAFSYMGLRERSLIYEDPKYDTFQSFEKDLVNLDYKWRNSSTNDERDKLNAERSVLISNYSDWRIENKDYVTSLEEVRKIDSIKDNESIVLGFSAFLFAMGFIVGNTLEYKKRVYLK